MRLFIYDLEIFAFDWIAVFKEVTPNAKPLVIHNNNHKIKQLLAQSDIVLGGFNNKHYDDWILQTILSGAEPFKVKEHNNWIIKEKREGWTFPHIKGNRKNFKSFDLKDDIADPNISLKAIEGNLGLPIVESSVPFDLDRPLTKDELLETVKYCINDVNATIKLYEKRKDDYIDAKLLVADMYDIEPQDAIGLTNAKLSAKVLGAKRVDRDDEREYVIPSNIDTDLIPTPILDFFNLIQDKSITDKQLFGDGNKKGMTLDVIFKTAKGECPVTYAWGGVHGAKPCVTVEESDTRVIVNQDVGSLYPNSMLNFGYCSRSMGDPKAYAEIVKKRLAYKHNGDKKRANALKLVVNTVYGAMLNSYNDLLDKWAGRSVCISNQLAMTMLIVMLAKQCESIDFININTDGIMFTIDKAELELSEKIIKAWCDVTKFEMERDDFIKVIQKDVNNYIGIKADGSFKTKGGYVSLYKGGNFKTNSLQIIDKAIVEYLVHGIKPEQTINECTDILAFQQIVKTGSTFESSYQYINGERVPLQKVNRIFATKKAEYGSIVKGKWIHEKTLKGKLIKYDPPLWSESTIPECPIHAYADNTNQLTVNDLDKQYYIDMAYKRIDKYLNIDSKVKRKIEKIKEIIEIMATKKVEENAENFESSVPQRKFNIYTKLALARLEFLKKDVKKSGVNRQAEFKYFELADIVPVACDLFNKLGLLLNISFDKEIATATLINIDQPSETLTFTSPLVEDNNNNFIKSPIQRLGAQQTYIRRYLYMLVLDIVEADLIDATSDNDEPKKAVKPNKPVSEEKRAEIKDELINADGNATDLQIKSIKNALKKLREKDGDNETYIASVIKKVKSGISKKDAEALLIEIGDKVNN